MNLLSTTQKGALYAIISGLCYGLLGYFGITIIEHGLSLPNMLFWRFFLAALCVFILLIPKYKTLLENPVESAKVIFYGIAFYSTASIAFFVASRYIGTGLSMVIFFTYPAMVMLFNFIFYKAKISKTYYLAFTMIIIGMICLADLQGITLNLIGILFGLLSGLFYCCYIVASKSSKVPPLISTFMVSLGSMLACFFFACAEGSFCIPNNFDQWINIIAIGVICTALPILLLLEALKYITSEKASILSVLEPVFVVIFGIILLGEQVQVVQALGVIIVLSGAILTLL